MSKCIDALQNDNLDNQLILKLITENDLDYLNKKNKDGVTALMVASGKNCTNFVKELLKRNVNVNDQDNKYFDAIMFAVLENNYDITKLLIEYGANVNNRYYCMDNQTLLDIATFHGNFDITKLLLEYNAVVNTKNNFIHCNPLFTTAYLKNYDILRLLLEHDIDINIKNKYGQTVFENCCNDVGNYILETIFSN